MVSAAYVNSGGIPTVRAKRNNNLSLVSESIVLCMVLLLFAVANRTENVSPKFGTLLPRIANKARNNQKVRINLHGRMAWNILVLNTG